MKAGGKLLVVSGILLGGGALIGVALPPRTSEVRFHDDFARPGEPFQLSAKVASGRIRGLFGGVENALVDFEVDGERAGASDTDGEGRARARFALGTTGPYEVFVRAKLPTGGTLPPTRGFLRVLEPDDRILITDIDGVLAEGSEWGLVFRSARLARPIPGAAEALRDLSRSFVIAYVTRRDEDLDPVTREWLEDHDFPRGPIYFARSFHDPFDAAVFQKQTVHLLHNRFHRIVAGIGSDADDAAAYRENDVPAYLLVREKGKVPASARSFGDWDSLADAIRDDLDRR